MSGTLPSPQAPLHAHGQMGTQAGRALGGAQAPHAQGSEVQAASAWSFPLRPSSEFPGPTARMHPEWMSLGGRQGAARWCGSNWGDERS